MLKSQLFILVFLLGYGSVFAQSVSGSWKGVFEMTEPENIHTKFRLDLSPRDESGNSFEGTGTTYFENDSIVSSIRGKRIADNEFELEETGVVKAAVHSPTIPCRQFFNVHLVRRKKGWKMEGTWYAETSTGCGGSGLLYLDKLK